jgi:diguanylate cyclase (GGDEF)-like protein
MVAERIRTSCSKMKVRTAGNKVNPTLSLGCASSECFRRPGVNRMIKESDRALYRAKSAGRDRVELCAELEPASPRKKGKPFASRKK